MAVQDVVWIAGAPGCLFSTRAFVPSALTRSSDVPESAKRIFVPSGDHDGAKAEDER